jgi:hypothetical protein
MKPFFEDFFRALISVTTMGGSYPSRPSRLTVARLELKVDR